MPDLDKRFWISCGLFFLCIAPYFPLWNAPLLGNDTPVWVEQGQIESSADFLDMLRGPHFNYFRPVTAISYAVGAYPGQEWAAHLLDFSLVFVSLWILLAIFTRVFSFGYWQALTLCLCVGCHPAIEQLVPYQARRGDLLAVLWSLFYLYSVFRDKPWWQKCLWFALGIGSKEMVFLLLPGTFVYYWSEREGNPAARLSLAIRRVIPDVVVAALFLAIRLQVIHGLGGSQGAGREGLWYLIPVDYIMAIVFPYSFAAFTTNHSLGIVIAIVLAFALGFVLRGKWSPASRMCLCFLVLDTGLYLYLGIWQFRRIFLGMTLFVIFAAAQMRGSQLRFLTLLLLLVPPAAAQLVSQPWQRMRTLTTASRDYFQRLDRVVAKVNHTEFSFASFDLPAFLGYEDLAIHESVAFPGRVIGTRIAPLLLDSYVSKQVHSLLYPNRKVIHRPLLNLTYLQPNPEITIERLPATDPEELAFRLAGHGFSALPNAHLAPFVEILDSNRYRIGTASLGGNMPGYLFLAALNGGQLLELPKSIFVEIQVEP